MHEVKESYTLRQQTQDIIKSLENANLCVEHIVEVTSTAILPATKDAAGKFLNSMKFLEDVKRANNAELKKQQKLLKDLKDGKVKEPSTESQDSTAKVVSNT